MRQGCPLYPYLFVIVMTIIMKDIGSQFTHEIRRRRTYFSNEQPIGMDGHDKLLYADDTLILASSRQAAESCFTKYKKNQTNII